MIIQSFVATNGPFENPFVIVPGQAEANRNHITVLIGENGARKSLALRILMDAALGKSTHDGHGHPRLAITAAVSGDLPRKVIAVSQTPWDRFPRAWGLSSLSTSVPWFGDRFVYIGARSPEGLVSTRYSELTFGRIVLENRWSFEKRRKSLEPIFDRLGLATAVGIRLTPNWSFKRLAGRTITDESMNTFRRNLARRSRSVGQDPNVSDYWRSQILEFEQEFSTADGINRLWRIAEKSLSPRITCWITPDITRFSHGFESIEQWRCALYLGLFKVSGVFFARAGQELPTVTREAVRDYTLSSGQWSWLFGLVGLCVELDDNSLVLIDEPENSLHPRWQREFIGTLSTVLSCSAGCHAVVATHSALISSGIREEIGNVRRLTLHAPPIGSTHLSSVTGSEEPNSNYYGAQSDDIYRDLFELESTRTPEFVLRVNELLAQIRDARGQRPVVAADDISFLLTAQASLPAHDPMRGILSAIADSLTVAAPEA